MHKIQRYSILFIIALLGWGALHAAPGPKIQVALLLDTSNSMDGLIEQAKSQLWKVVNEFALARQNGQAPELEIALYEYGNDGLSSKSGHIRQVAPLTTDLDLISEKLFQLTTNGGEEYCGRVIQTAAKELAWSADANVLKVVFIAGNEPFSQGKVDYRSACREAIARGIIVNTIFCGDFQEGVETAWKEGADLSDGKYMNIDQNLAVVHIDAPQDSALQRLNDALNSTYVPYGREGERSKERQLEQDANAAAYGAGNVAQRSASKASAYYHNASWDLVDAVEDGSVDLDELRKEDLPEPMQNMSAAERQKFIDGQRAKRAEIREKIRRLDAERRRYVAEKEKQMSGSGALDRAIIDAVREQAAKKNFRFE
ncbi:MAG: VWA domain-containing protein [Calditrichaceae bacterium]|nr:VWA domain-containing protein [Calditrichia bacterium]NUQ41875.1 VWA domain-containing protein [Calditrichaceae bacterium]